MFHERLKLIRANSGLSQKDISAKCEIGLRTLKYYESGRVNPTSDVIIKLCNYFNISADYLLGLTDEPRPLREEDTSNNQKQ